MGVNHGRTAAPLPVKTLTCGMSVWHVTCHLQWQQLTSTWVPVFFLSYQMYFINQCRLYQSVYPNQTLHNAPFAIKVAEYTWYIFIILTRQTTFISCWFSCRSIIFSKRDSSKRKEFAPTGSKLFPLRMDPLPKGGKYFSLKVYQHRIHLFWIYSVCSTVVLVLACRAERVKRIKNISKNIKENGTSTKHGLPKDLFMERSVIS